LRSCWCATGGSALFRRLQLAYYRHREKLWALDGTLSQSIEGYYHDLLRREGEAAGLGPTKSALFIGAGATPYTPVALAREFGCCVTAIDRDRLAALMAKRYLASKAPELPILACYGSGEEFDVSGFDAVMLALHAGRLTAPPAAMTSQEAMNGFAIRRQSDIHA